MEGKDLSGIDEREFLARQKVIDVEKWLASERAGRDLCGTMAYCGFCVKAEMNPCAKAEFRHKMRLALDELAGASENGGHAAADETVSSEEELTDEVAAAADEGENTESAEEEQEGAAAEEQDPSLQTQDILEEESAEEIVDELLADRSEGKREDPVLAAEEVMSEAPVEYIDAERRGDNQTEAAEPHAVPEGYEEVIRYRRSFKARLIQNERAQDYYTELKNALAELSGVKSRLCQSAENFRIGRKRVARINIGGKTLVMYLALDPRDYEESKYRFTDVSDRKTYAETPMKLRITSARALKHAKELIEELAEKYSLANVGCIYMDYHYPYRTDEQLIEKGLIKPYKTLVKKKK